MACDVRLAREAETDVARIVAYLVDSLGSPQAATSFLEELTHAVSTIGELPESYPGATEPRLARMGYRKALVGRCVLLYRKVDGVVVIAHVFHGSQDYARLV